MHAAYTYLGILLGFLVSMGNHVYNNAVVRVT